jgi:hypothetical protein
MVLPSKFGVNALISPPARADGFPNRATAVTWSAASFGNGWRKPRPGSGAAVTMSMTAAPWE